MILDWICSWLLPEEVEVGPLEVLIVKSKGEDSAEIVLGLFAIFGLFAIYQCKSKTCPT